MRRLRKFMTLCPEDRKILGRAGLVLVAVRLGLWLLPSRLVLRAAVWRGRPARARRSSTSPVPVERLAWAVRAAARYNPAATCLTQAIALQWLLVRSGYKPRIHIGVKKGAQAWVEAHAWVECNDRIVIGGPQVNDYVRLAALG